MLVDLTAKTRHAFPQTMFSEDSDLSLVRRLVEGEDSAMQDLYAAYGQRLYAYALRLTDDPALAEDVVQDTLVAAWRSARQFRGQGRLLAWLLGIVHHTALKSLRHRARSISDELEETLVEAQPSPEQTAEQADASNRLRAGINSLSPDHRAVLELVFYQGLSLEEVAQVCRIPLGTVKSRLSYARRSLQGLLLRQGLEDIR